MLSMLSDDEVVALSDIQFNIELAEQFVEGLDLDHFVGDMKSFYAVTCCLEIISEASRRISPAFKERFPNIPWKESRALAISTGIITRMF